MTSFIRSIGRWTMTGLVINATIGSSIFALPGELSRLLGRASPLAVVLAALGLVIIMAAIIEVASQFPDAGGTYTYVRAAFGRFWGLQVGWFWLLSFLGGCAAAATVFVTYVANFFPGVDSGWRRVVIISVVLAVPTIANCLGVRRGANLCNFFTATKLLPLVLIVVLGFLKFHNQFGLIHPHEIVAPGWNAWLTGLLLLLAAMGGAEDTLAPCGRGQRPPSHNSIRSCDGLPTLRVAIHVCAVCDPRDVELLSTRSPARGCSKRSPWPYGHSTYLPRCHGFRLRDDCRRNYERSASHLCPLGARRFSTIFEPVASQVSHSRTGNLSVRRSALGSRHFRLFSLVDCSDGRLNGRRVRRNVCRVNPPAKSTAESRRPTHSLGQGLRLVRDCDLYRFTHSVALLRVMLDGNRRIGRRRKFVVGFPPSQKTKRPQGAASRACIKH